MITRTAGSDFQESPRRRGISQVLYIQSEIPRSARNDRMRRGFSAACKAAHRACAKAGFHVRDTSRRNADEEPQTLEYRSAPARPDVRKAFRSERAVNDALHLVIELRKVASSKRRDSSSNGA
jgi:hypothetical protein